MARGKYAAKAAGQRAAAAAETVDALKGQLATERATAAREIAELKTETQRLAGQLTSAVKQMAAAEVERVHVAAVEQLEAVRAEHRNAALSVAALLGKSQKDAVTPETLQALADILKVPFGEFMAATGEPEFARRVVQRATSAKWRQGQANMDAGYGPGGARSGALQQQGRVR